MPIPWRLQINFRSNRPCELLYHASQCDLDGTGGQHETPQHGPVGHGDSVATDAATPQGANRSRKPSTCSPRRRLSCEKLLELVHGLCDLTMQNDQNWCYANSTIYGLLWCLLCLPQSSSAAWGPRCGDLAHFICAHAATPAALKNVSWFRHILFQWGCSQGQQDCAELVHCTLTWLNAPAFDMRWERRLESMDGTLTVDHGDAFMPLKLTFTHAMHTWGTCTLNDMMQTWCQEDSHCAAFLDAPPCLCLHLDRYHQDENGIITKTDCCLTLDTEILVPVFVSTGIAYESTGYIPVAVIAHLGADREGHYRAILKMQPTVLSNSHPAQWMITEDSIAPQPVWAIPPWMIQNATIIWLVRTDLLSLPCYSSKRLAFPDLAEHATSPDAALLTLLQAQEGVTE
eukprot:s3302_g4.t1